MTLQTILEETTNANITNPDAVSTFIINEEIHDDIITRISNKNATIMQYDIKLTPGEVTYTLHIRKLVHDDYVFIRTSNESIHINNELRDAIIAMLIFNRPVLKDYVIRLQSTNIVQTHKNLARVDVTYKTVIKRFSRLSQ